MEKKAKFEALFSGAGKAAKKLYENAVLAADQNDDGKFDLSDVSAIAEAVGENVKKGTQSMKATAEEKARQMELKTLQPIFTETLDSAEFSMPKFIRIVERDKRYLESEVCQNSIGHFSDQKGLHIVNIFRDSIDIFGLMFYPDSDSEFYYVDPSERDRYLALDEYFKYLKVARIGELQKIAQDLGAKHFRIVYHESDISFTEAKGAAHLKTPAKIDAEHHSVEKQNAKGLIAAEMECPGHAPVRPSLKYLYRDPAIQNLIALRMDETSPLQRQKLTIEFSNSCGIKESDAIKIDSVLKGMKLGGSITVASEAKKETHRFFEYEIEF